MSKTVNFSDSESPSDWSEQVFLPFSFVSRQAPLVYFGLLFVLSAGFLVMNVILLFSGEETVAGNGSAVLMAILAVLGGGLANLSFEYWISRLEGKAARSGPQSQYFLIPEETSFDIFLIVTRLLALLPFLLELGARFKGPSVVPFWILQDAGLWIVVSTVCLIFAESSHAIDCRSQKIFFERQTLFYTQRREIDFAEIAAVATGGVCPGAAALLQFFVIDFVTYLVLSTGQVIPVFSSGKNMQGVFWGFRNQVKAGLRLAKLVGKPQLAFPFERNEGLVSLREIMKPLLSASAAPAELEKTLNEILISATGLVSIEPGKINVDYTTYFEKVMLALIVILLAITTVFFLFYELEYLRNNPRFLYLIILDISSIFATVFGLWKLIIDEYYILDMNEKNVSFFSRIFFVKTTETLGSFQHFQHISMRMTKDSSSNKPPSYDVILAKATGVPVQISDPTSQESIALFRALAVSKVTGIPLCRKTSTSLLTHFPRNDDTKGLSKVESKDLEKKGNTDERRKRTR